MTYPTIAKVRWWEDSEGEMREEKVFFYSRSISDAADIMENWYGKDSIEEITIRLFDDGPIKVDEDFEKKYLEDR